MRGKDPRGRFDTEFEMGSIYEGISEDNQVVIGQTVQWWVFDSVHSLIDPIYDVGSATSLGREFLAPVTVPVVMGAIVQGQYMNDDRGFYTSDALRLTVAADKIEAFFPGFSTNSDPHMKDRILWRNEIFSPSQIWPKAYVHDMLAVVTIQADQVKPDQMVNDPQFAAYLQ